MKHYDPKEDDVVEIKDEVKLSKTEETLYNLDGDVTTDDAERIFAKKISGQSNCYFLKISDEGLFNVQRSQGDIRYINKTWTWRSVRYEKFSLYLRYLKTGRQTFLTQAERIN
jgi:hypothetical protein